MIFISFSKTLFTCDSITLKMILNCQVFQRNFSQREISSLFYILILLNDGCFYSQHHQFKVSFRMMSFIAHMNI